MDTALGSQVTVKIFIGCPLTPELKMHLAQSSTWKQAAIMRGYEKDVLIETQFHHKTYLGLYADERSLTLAQIRLLQQRIYEKLSLYCPKVQRLERISLYLFPQLFVGELTTMLPPLILASHSPRRAEILSALKIPFAIEISHFDEESLPFTGYPQDYVCQLARGKATMVARQHPNALVIGADTLVFLDGRPFGKPTDRQQALEYLQLLSGQWNTVYTGVSLSYNGRTYEEAEESRVLFNTLTPTQIAAYVDSGEWQGRSGGYTLLGWGALLIAQIEGCCHNVMGLPLTTLQKLMLRCGYDLWQYVGRS